jgi:hypothetical protein
MLDSRFDLLAVLVLALATLLAGCGGDDDDDDLILIGDLLVPPGTSIVGTAGGIITSDDGNLALTIAPGALAADTMLSITALDPAELETDYPLAASFALAPANQQFALPVVVSYQLAGAAPAADAAIPSAGVLLLATGGAVTPLDEHVLVVDDAGNRMLLLGELTHFSRLDYSPAQVHIEPRLLEVDTAFEQELGVEWTLGATPPTVSGGELEAQDATTAEPLTTVDLGALDPLPDGLLPTTAPFGDADDIRTAIIGRLQLDTVVLPDPTVPYTLDSFSWIRRLDLEPAVGLDVEIPTIQMYEDLGQLYISGEVQLTPKLSTPPETVQGATVEVTLERADTGDTIVIGGLVSDDQGRVPFLSEIPLLTAYFASATRVEREALLILITPNLVEVEP